MVDKRLYMRFATQNSQLYSDDTPETDMATEIYKSFGFQLLNFGKTTRMP